MSKSKSDEKESAVLYRTVDLLKSKALSRYQPDFVRVILTKPEYTLEEAISTIEGELSKEV